jgi:nucleotide-binding universal stress UspA family protein
MPFGSSRRRARCSEHILIPLDGSSLAECVLPHGLAMAGRWARAPFLQVVERPKAAGRTRPSTRSSGTTAKPRRGVPAEWGKSARRDCRRRRPAQGDAAERDRSRTGRGADLILLSSHGRSGLSGWNVSSVVQKILAGLHLGPADRPTIRRRPRSPPCATSASSSRSMVHSGRSVSCRWRGRWQRGTTRRSS